MPYPNEHAARVRDPGDFQPDSFRSKTLPKSKGGKGGVRMIIGKLKGESTTTVQAYRFPIDLYTPAEARAWLKENDVKYTSFEEASGEKEAIDHANEIIRQEGGKWVLYSHDGSKKLGTFDTKEEAEEHERQVQAFKHMESVYYEVDIQPRATEADASAFEGREWDVTLIGPKVPTDLVSIKGQPYLRSQNGRLYNLKALAESAPTWDGTKVYDNHLTDKEFEDRAGMRSVAREWIGSIVKPRWDEDAKQLRGVLKVVEESVARKLKNAWDAGILKTIGLSIDTLTIPGQEAVIEGRSMPTVEGFQRILSVDLVAEPAAGGGFNRLIAAQTQTTPQTAGQEATSMNEQELKALVTRLVTEALADKSVSDERKEALTDVVFSAALGAKASEAEDPEKAVRDLVGAMVVVEAVQSEEDEEQTTESEQETEHETETEQAQEAQKADEETRQIVRRLECKILLRDKLDAAKLNDAHRRVVESVFDGQVFEEAELDKVIKRTKEAQAAQDPSGRVAGAGGNGNVQVIITAQQKAEAEFMRIVMGNSSYRGLEAIQEDFVKDRMTESYKAWQKDGRPQSYGFYRISDWMHEFYGDPFTDTPARASEAVTTSGMSSIVKNTVNIMLAADYAKRHRWWEPIVRTEEVDTIDDSTLVRIYGLNTLSVVNEGQAYTELSWTDEEETASFAKRGNYVGITLEAMLSDKLNAIRTLPNRLATSWYNTQSGLVSAVFTTNTATGPVLADTGALFNNTAVTNTGGHANLLTTALSYTAYGAARTAMMKQTDQTLGTGQKLLISPKFLLVPVDLETAALQIRNSEMLPGSGNNDVNPYYQKFEVVPVPNFTDATDWALVADPNEFPAIWMIYIRGKRVPEIYDAGDERGGAMFTNDTLRYKVRFMSFRFSSTYDCAPVSDWRPLHKSNCAG